MNEVMSILLEETVAEVMRGDRDLRPLADRESAERVRGSLEGALGALRLDATTPRHVTAADIRNHTLSALDGAVASRLRGTLVAEILGLLSVGCPVGDPYGDAVDAWRASAPSGPLLQYADSLGGDERARLATDVDAHAVTLMQRLGPLSPRWLPRIGARSTVRLGRGGLTCHDVVDLTVGSTHSDYASVALLDVTSSPLGSGHERALRYHALVETLRSGVVPLRVVTLSTATGEISAFDVDGGLLDQAAADLLDVVNRTCA